MRFLVFVGVILLLMVPISAAQDFSLDHDREMTFAALAGARMAGMLV